MTQVGVVTEIDLAVARLDHWLDTMRGPEGYGGPVVHWWRNCMVFCDVGLDWRYEGIIAGYLTLYERTGQSRWLQKARRAGNDLVRGQLPSGHFHSSRFELNPGIGGTPHEAAADVGLLLLARALRDGGHEEWRTYLEAAEKNLTAFFIDCLWDESEQRFQDDVQESSFVPNKAATLIEALCLLAELSGKEEYLQHYVRPTAEAILAHQVRSSGSRMEGAIAQNSLGRTLVERYFPYYNARCIPGLLAAHQLLGEPRYLDAAAIALGFILRWRDADGGFPQVIYPGGRLNRYPRWVAAVGDVLRAADLLRRYGVDFPSEQTLSWLLGGQLPSGAIATARGFGAQVSQLPELAQTEFRDLLPVCGWADKAFRYLATRIDGVPQEAANVTAISRLDCMYLGRAVTLVEDDSAIALESGTEPLYRWRKGSPWAQIAAPWTVSV